MERGTEAVFKGVQILYPRGVASGGPQALFQLGEMLRRHGVDAWMVPHPETASAPAVSAYARYGVPTRPLRDEPGYAFVASELRYDLLFSLRHVTRFCWWLSIDNALLFEDARRFAYADLGVADQSLALRNRIGAVKRSVTTRLRGDRRRLQAVNHLAQSEYARAYVNSVLGVNPSMVTDYIELEVPPQAVEPVAGQVAFNAVKGATAARSVLSRIPGAHPLALHGMSRSQLVRNLAASDLYLDLGHHPGKDRLPREAAAVGTPVVVARRGAGAYWSDVPIADQYKVDLSVEYEAGAVAAVERVLADQPGARAAQSGYREWVNGERAVFEREVLTVFRDLRYEHRDLRR